MKEHIFRIKIIFEQNDLGCFIMGKKIATC